jgi:predicted DNA-binding transcriptional regulator AlpA
VGRAPLQPAAERLDSAQDQGAMGVNDLLTIDDIAAMLRVKRRTVAEKWLARPDFPRPHVAPTRRTRRWLAADVMAWAQRAVAQ